MLTDWNLQILTVCALRMLGKILFIIILPISGSCQSMVYIGPWYYQLKYGILKTSVNKSYYWLCGVKSTLSSLCHKKLGYMNITQNRKWEISLKTHLARFSQKLCHAHFSHHRDGIMCSKFHLDNLETERSLRHNISPTDKPTVGLLQLTPTPLNFISMGYANKK